MLGNARSKRGRTAYIDHDPSFAKLVSDRPHRDETEVELLPMHATACQRSLRLDNQHPGGPVQDRVFVREVLGQNPGGVAGHVWHVGHQYTVRAPSVPFRIAL